MGGAIVLVVNVGGTFSQVKHVGPDQGIPQQGKFAVVGVVNCNPTK